MASPSKRTEFVGTPRRTRANPRNLRPDDPPGWLDELRDLVGRRRRSDREAADLLSDPKEYPQFFPWLWTTDTVRHWRVNYLNMPANKGWAEFDTAAELYEFACRTRAASAGYGHLLPYHDEDTKQEVPGQNLTPTMVNVLRLLTEHGPMTRQQLREASGSTLRVGARSGRCAIAMLLSAGLVEVTNRMTTRGNARVYCVSAAATTHRRTKRDTSIESLLKGLNVRA